MKDKIIKIIPAASRNVEAVKLIEKTIKKELSEVSFDIKTTSNTILFIVGDETEKNEIVEIARKATENKILTILLSNTAVTDNCKEIVDCFFVVPKNNSIYNFKDIVEAIAQPISENGIINLKVEEINALLKKSGECLFSLGEANGENRSKKVVENALSNFNLNNKIVGAKKILVNIASSSSLGLNEASEIVNSIKEKASFTCKEVMFAIEINDNMDDNIKISVILNHN